MKSPRQVLAIGAVLAVMFSSVIRIWTDKNEGELLASQFSDQPHSFSVNSSESGVFTWWLPRGGDSFVLPISAGVVVDATDAPLMRWLKEGSPWELLELPVFGV